MANAYYNASGTPGTGAFAASAPIRSEYAAIAAGFDKLPTLSAGTASKAVIVNAGGTALTVTTGTFALAGNFATTGAFNTTLIQGASVSLTLPVVSGTLATLAGTETLSNKTLVAPALGTPVSGVLTNCTGFPAGSLTGLGTGVAIALAINVGTAGAVVLSGGALGTPSSGTLTNATGLPLSTGVTGTLAGANGGTGVANTGKTITLGGSLTTSGAFDTTLTVTAGTNVTLPTTGTLAILGANTFTGTQTLMSGTTSSFSLAASSKISAALGGSLYGIIDTSGNVGWGLNANSSLTSGTGNISLGLRANRLVSSGTDNVAIGTEVLRTASTGTYNIGVGYSPLFALTTGSHNIALGYNAGAGITTAIGNILLGLNAGVSIVNSAGPVETSPNVAIGYSALKWLTDGGNVALGAYSVGGNRGSAGTSSGFRNVGLGRQALGGVDQGNHNTAVGDSSMAQLTSGGSNTAVGRGSMGQMVTGAYNVAVGHAAGYWQSAGDSNTFIGNGTGALNTSGALYTGGTNSYFGESAGTWGQTANFQLMLGHYAQSIGTTDHVTVIGNAQVAAYVSGNLSSTYTPTAINNAAGVTWTATEMRGRLIDHAGAVAVSDTTATAAAIVASLPGVQKNVLSAGVSDETNAGYELYVSNSNSGVLTIVPNVSGVTGVGSMTIAAGATAVFVVRATNAGSGTEAVTIKRVGDGGGLGTAAYQNIGTLGANVPLLNAVNTWGATQTFGALIYTTLNGNTWATGTGTLSIAAGKTLTASNTLTLTGTDASSIAFGTGGTVLYNGGALGTPASGTLTNATGLPAASIVAGALANGMTATTQTQADNSTKLSTTAYVDAAILLRPRVVAMCNSTGTTRNLQYNVASITKNSTGNYTFNLTSNVSANAVVEAILVSAGGSSGDTTIISQTASAITVGTFNAGGTVQDFDGIQLVVFDNA